MKKSLILTVLCICNFITYYAAVTIQDVSQIQVGMVKEILTPTTIEELQAIVAISKGPIAVAGGKFSQGGHVWCTDGIVIDMNKLNRVIALDAHAKKITVEAGIRWSEVQQVISRAGLSVRVMQSYNDFSVGGSLSVNAHGRDISAGPIIETIESIKIVLANGLLITASRDENYDLFKAVIGGYGACGIIVEVTLYLTENYAIERSVKRMKIEEYTNFFYKNIHKNPEIVFHNANVYPNELKEILAITWYKTTRQITITDSMQMKISHFNEIIIQKLLTWVPPAKKLRLFVAEHLYYRSSPVVWRNYEMSSTVASLEPYSRWLTTPLLQEYFVPIANFEAFIADLQDIVDRHNVNILNLSIRYVPENKESLLSYATQECFSLVLFINILNTEKGYAHAQKWTQELIEKTINVQGTYYLPYQPFATRKQFETCYPHYTAFRLIQQKYDPDGVFSNSFVEKYIA